MGIRFEAPRASDPAQGIRILAGKEIRRNMGPIEVFNAVRTIHRELGVQSRLGKIYQPPRRDIWKGILRGRYLIAIDAEKKIAATGQIRREKQHPSRIEVGGGINIQRIPRLGEQVAIEAIRLAWEQKGAKEVVGYVSSKNEPALRLFDKLGIREPGLIEKTIPTTGEKVMVVTFRLPRPE